MSKFKTLEGTVKALGELYTAPSGNFRKRTLVVRDEETSGKYENLIPLTAKKDNVALLDGLREGDRVRVEYTMDGRVWNDPKTGKDKYFLDLTVQKVERIGADGRADVPPPAEPPEREDDDIPSDMPF